MTKKEAIEQIEELESLADEAFIADAQDNKEEEGKAAITESDVAGVVSL